MSEVEYAVEGHIGRLTLNRPEKMNAMTDAMYAAIGDAVREPERDREVRALPRTGAAAGRRAAPLPGVQPCRERLA